MTRPPSRPSGHTTTNARRDQRAIEDLDRVRLRLRRAVRRIEALPDDATLAQVIRAVNALRKALVD